MTQSFRLDNTGLINKNKKISFKFNGKNYFGYEGDTLASALIANGVHLVGRSFKYHRPRGFFGAGVDEPYAIVQLSRNGETDPNVRATEQELFEGLEAKSVNCWPSVNFDIGAINNFLNIFFYVALGKTSTHHKRGCTILKSFFRSHYPLLIPDYITY